MATDALPVIIFTGLPGSGVELIPGSSPEFTLASQAIDGGQTVGELAPILPYLAIVKNPSALGLVSVAVRYTKKDEVGKVDHTDCILLTMQNRRSRMVLRGEMALMGPFGGSPILRGADGSGCGAPAPNLEERAREYASFASIDIALDSVVFEDGRLVGPDEIGTQARIESNLRVQRTLTAEVRARTDESTREYLSAIIATPTATAGTCGEFDWYDFELRMTASMLLSLLHGTQSEAGFFDRMESLLGSPIPSPFRR